MFNWLKKKRREHYKSSGLSSSDINIIGTSAPLCLRVPADLRKPFYETVAVFLHEKNFEGCGGLQINDEIKLTIASQASLLLLGDISDFYPDLYSILVYPSPYYAPVHDLQDDGVVVEGRELRHGESWGQGSLVLAWDEVRSDSANPGSGRNLVIHEFAHEIDQQFGLTEVDILKNFQEWGTVLQTEYEKHLEMVDNNHPTLLDPYGATNLAEFFAVSTEAFFGIPERLKQGHPELYQQFCKIYNLDTEKWNKL